MASPALATELKEMSLRDLVEKYHLGTQRADAYDVEINNWLILWLVSNVPLAEVTIARFPHISAHPNVLSPIAFNINAKNAAPSTPLGQLFREV